MQPRVLIIGFGLMGGSAGLALRARGWHVAYLDDNVPFRGRAREAADERLKSIERDEPLVLLATHIDGAREWLPRLRTNGVITSLCSLMQPLKDVAPRNFIAGHPMAGSHLSGVRNASADLYRGKKWFLEKRDARIERLICACGARVQIVKPRAHDEAMALTSQLPQVLSTALAAYLRDRNVLEFAGSGLKDFLRLAGSHAAMWEPILDANRETLAPHANAVMDLVKQLVDGDAENAFEDANALFRSLT
ncbi:MAG: prephenate dehydrogenase [Thermoanaerobaculia bacterium]